MKSWLLVGALTGAAVAGCDPKVIGNESAGDLVCEDGETKPADDECNTCTCVDGGWACTEIACGGGNECVDGETKPAGDGCNTCSCVNGMWGCTLIGCEDPPPDPVCTPGDTMPSEDGCNTCSCTEEGQWVCTQKACSTCGDGVVDAGEGCDDGNVVPGDGCDAACQIEGNGGDAIQICEDGILDPKTIKNAAIVGDALEVELEFGGGCAEHEFTYCWDGLFLESFPVQVNTTLFHNANGDACDAVIAEKLSLDLSPLKTEYQKSYQTMTGEISIGLADWQGGALLYSF